MVGAICIQWAENRDAAKHPVGHRTAPTTRKYLEANVKSAEVEKPQLEKSTELENS